MFVGTTPQEVRLLLQELLKNEKDEVYVGCSGNFSSDKVISGMGLKVRSNDVCLYSKLVSDIVLGKDTEVKVVNEELAGVFAHWPETKYKKLVEVMFAMKVSGFNARKNEYQRVMFDNYLMRADDYFTRTVEKFERGNVFGFQIQDFFFGDFVEHLHNARERGAIGVSFPPTYKNGYEHIFAFVESCFEYERAKYNVFDPKESGGLFRELLESGRNVLYSDKDRPELERYKVGKVVLGGGKHSVYIYSSLHAEHQYYIENCAVPKVSKVDVVSPDYGFTEDAVITVKEVPYTVINYYKAFYMGNKVNYSTGKENGLVFLVDGKAFGFVAFSMELSDYCYVFMHADFVVNSHTKKLSKLLIMLTKCKDVRRHISRIEKRYYCGLRTAVYTDKPVSMKYRGVYELERRYKGKIMYKADFEEVSLNEMYRLWIKKYKKN